MKQGLANTSGELSEHTNSSSFRVTESVSFQNALQRTDFLGGVGCAHTAPGPETGARRLKEMQRVIIMF